ncbi:MAG: hypothetical protein BWY57_02553 [Betaproteobacteria bacterium ADurb.Bin341]|nr:MAG: hypothetical protein BWY57_02553 [Betaproteobacteria bacterium ADurb.Bin341]
MGIEAFEQVKCALFHQPGIDHPVLHHVVPPTAHRFRSRRKVGIFCPHLRRAPHQFRDSRHCVAKHALSGLLRRIRAFRGPDVCAIYCVENQLVVYGLLEPIPAPDQPFEPIRKRFPDDLAERIDKVHVQEPVGNPLVVLPVPRRGLQRVDAVRAHSGIKLNRRLCSVEPCRDESPCFLPDAPGPLVGLRPVDHHGAYAVGGGRVHE